MRTIKKKVADQYRVQFFGINTWHDYIPDTGEYPMGGKEKAICYANFLRSLLNWKAVRIVDSNGFVDWQRGRL